MADLLRLAHHTFLHQPHSPEHSFSLNPHFFIFWRLHTFQLSSLDLRFLRAGPTALLPSSSNMGHHVVTQWMLFPRNKLSLKASCNKRPYNTTMSCAEFLLSNCQILTNTGITSIGSIGGIILSTASPQSSLEIILKALKLAFFFQARELKTNKKGKRTKAHAQGENDSPGRPGARCRPRVGVAHPPERTGARQRVGPCAAGRDTPAPGGPPGRPLGADLRAHWEQAARRCRGPGALQGVSGEQPWGPAALLAQGEPPAAWQEVAMVARVTGPRREAEAGGGVRPGPLVPRAPQPLLSTRHPGGVPFP